MRFKWCTRRFWLAVIPFTVIASSAAAQSAIQNPKCRGMLHGIVSDQQGRPAPEIKVEAWPLGVDLGVVLPEAKTDYTGEYLFYHLCPGRYTVLPYDMTELSPYDFEFLYARRLPEAKLTDKNVSGEIPVELPPSPGKVDVHVENRATNQKITTFTVELRVPGQRHWPWMKYLFDDRMRDCWVAVPPDKNFIMRIKATGFRNWRVSIDGHKLLRVASGQQQVLQARLVPLIRK
jgi:hypothetical protein